MSDINIPIDFPAIDSKLLRAIKQIRDMKDADTDEVKGQLVTLAKGILAVEQHCRHVESVVKKILSVAKFPSK